jgi:hypothetical protein
MLFASCLYAGLPITDTNVTKMISKARFNPATDGHWAVITDQGDRAYWYTQALVRLSTIKNLEGDIACEECIDIVRYLALILL